MFVGIDLCGGRTGDPAAPPSQDGDGARRALGPGRGALETRGRAAPPPAHAASRSVKLNKEGICCS